MSLIRIDHVSKCYKVNKENSFYALKNISLSFPHKGFFALLGKSGSGKSTLLNLIAGIDKPTEGKIFFINYDLNRFNKRKKATFLLNEIGYVFQHYELLDDYDVFFNVSLPLMMMGEKKHNIRKRTNILLRKLNISKLKNKKIYQLSGGEKQRVAIARALIKDPKIILCDEPTGALDENTSKQVMDILKEIANEKLVIIVSHNKNLVYDYVDHVIYLKDGKIDKEDKINDNKILSVPLIFKIKKHKSFWISTFAIKHMKSKWRRNLVSSFSLGLCLLFSFISIGFMANANQEINTQALKRADIGVTTLSKETEVNYNNGIVKLKKTTRPEYEEIKTINIDLDSYNVELNYDAIVPPGIQIKFNDKTIKEAMYKPIYSFEDKSVNKSLLIKGEFPKKDNLLEVVINKSFYDYFKNLNVEILNKRINIFYKFEHKYVSFDKDNAIISDIFEYNKNVKVVGIVDEISYLSSPTIYYSFCALDSFLSDT